MGRSLNLERGVQVCRDGESEMNNIVLVVLSVWVLTSCESQSREKQEMALQPISIVSHCIGRHIIDMPRSFSLAGDASGKFQAVGFLDTDPSIEVAVRAESMTLAQFAAMVRERRTELQDAGSDNVDTLEFEKNSMKE